MKIKATIYMGLVLLSALYRGYEGDAVGVALSLFVIPLVFVLYFKPD